MNGKVPTKAEIEAASHADELLQDRIVEAVGGAVQEALRASLILLAQGRDRLLWTRSTLRRATEHYATHPRFAPDASSIPSAFTYVKLSSAW